MSHIPIDTQANNAVMVHAAIPDEHKINTAVAPLPREIIRWLQSLNLHKPLKHPKRDFQSGYVVAEIIQRAAFSDDLHAGGNGSNGGGGGELLSLVDNVSSAKRKHENWAALQLYLRRHNHPVFPGQLVADVMNAKDNAADEMLLMLYVKYGGRGFPGASAATRGGPPPAPQPLDRVPTFHKRTAEDIAAAAAASSSSSGAAAGGKSSEAMKQLSAMAAEQLRAAELELLKQQSDSNLRAEIMGLNSAAGAGAGEQQQQQQSQQQQQQQKPRHLPRAPAVPQPMVQGQIRAVDKSAESDDKAVLFDHRVSMRQLSGAALQRFGFRDRSQSPNGSARGLSPASGAVAKGGRIGALASATTSGRGGVGAAVHGQLCLLIDRFVADFFAASTTWNPPADGSPLHYFIEQCSNAAVITPAFKATLWQFLLREAGTVAAVLACAPADTLYFVAHFANVSVEGRAPPPGDASFQNGDLWSPKFYGADALDSTLFCHAVLGALRTQKRAGADAMLRRYAVPALLPLLLLDAGGNSNNKVSLRRAIFAVSSLALGSCDPPGSSSSSGSGSGGGGSGGSSLHFYVQPLSGGGGATHVAGDLEGGAALSPQEHASRVQALQRMVLLLHDMLVADFDATVQYAARLFAPDDLQARLYSAVPAAVAASSSTNDDGGAAAAAPASGKTGGSAPASRPSTGNAAGKSRNSGDAAAAAASAHKRVVLEAAPAASGPARQTVALLCCEAFVDALRGELPPQRLYARDAPVPPAIAHTVAQLAAPFLPRAAAAEVSTPACAEAALKCLTALARSGAVATAAPEVVSLIVTQLQSVLPSMLAQNARGGGNDGDGARSRVKVELFRLLCATLRCTWRGSDDDDADENGGNNTTATLLNELFQRTGEVVARALQAGSVSDAERLVLASAVASSLANFPLPQGAGASAAKTSYAETFSGLAAFVVDSLVALPPSALEAFGLSGGNLGRALPSLFPAVVGGGANDSSAAVSRAALSNPLDCGRWSITALARCISERFQAHNSQTNPHKIAAPGKTGSAGVLKLAAPPAGFAADPLAPDFAAFLRPYRSILLLFTLLLARQSDGAGAGAAASQIQAASSVMQPQRVNEEIAAWWHMLTGPAGAAAAAAAADAQEASTRGGSAAAAGATAPPPTVTVTLGSELRKLLIYYDAARKGSAAVAPRTSNDAEAMHEIYVQAGRAALFVVVKLWSDLLGATAAAAPSTSQAGSMIPSHLQPSIAPALAALAARVSAPAAKASEDDTALGQQGLEIAVRAMEWFLGVLNGKQ